MRPPVSRAAAPRLPSFPAPSAPGASPSPAPAPAPPGSAPRPRPTETAPSRPSPAAPPPIATDDFGVPELKRLLWRAGFGPLPGDIGRLRDVPVGEVVRTLTRPQGEPRLVGPEPTDGTRALTPRETYGHDHLWWLDRMVRSDQPLVERMTLVFHDWLATSYAKVGSRPRMLDQNATLRANCLGSFPDLLLAVVRDPAMLVFLDGLANRRGSVNENLARELMELFTLGAGRGAYTERDVAEAARALTGFTADSSGVVRFVETRHDAGVKVIFGQEGRFRWDDVVRLCVEHPLHASFFVQKLWSYLCPVPLREAEQAALEQVYLSSGRQIRPVLEAMLVSRSLYEGPTMAKPPIVVTAGLLRAIGRGVDRMSYVSLAGQTGQLLFHPPNVAGWDDEAWFDTGTWRGRWVLAQYALEPLAVTPTSGAGAGDSADEAVQRGLAFLGYPVVTAETVEVLRAFAAAAVPPGLSAVEEARRRAMRQNALRHLIATCPDLQVS